MPLLYGSSANFNGMFADCQGTTASVLYVGKASNIEDVLHQSKKFLSRIPEKVSKIVSKQNPMQLQ